MSEWHSNDAVSTANLNTKCVLTGAVDQVVEGVKTFGSFPIGPDAHPSADLELCNKRYVDTFGGGGGGVPLDMQGWSFDATFSSVDYNTVAWTGGTLRFSKGTTHNILSGNTGNIAAVTYVYFHYNASTTTLQTTTNSANANGVGKVLIAVVAPNADAGKSAEYQAFGGVSGGVKTIITTDILAANVVTGNEILGNTITAAHIQAGSLDVGRLDFTPLYSTNGVNDIVATMNATSEGLRITTSLLEIDASVTFASGYDTSETRHASDVTKIDGGQIYTSSVTTAQLNFTAVQDTNVIASINASGEGGGTLNISAAKIAISGSVTFSSGYDPTDKFDLVNNDAGDIDETGGRKWAGESGADITGSHTANDTSNVNGLTSSKVSGWAHGSDDTTIDGGKVYVGSHLVVGTGNNVAVLSGSDATYRIWAGHQTAASASFSVTQAGILYCTGASIGGILETGSASQKIVIGESGGAGIIDLYNTAIFDPAAGTDWGAITLRSGAQTPSTQPEIIVAGVKVSNISRMAAIQGGVYALTRWNHPTAAIETAGWLSCSSTWGDGDVELGAVDDLILKVLTASDVVKVPTGNFDIVTGTLQIDGTEVISATREITAVSVQAVGFKLITEVVGYRDNNNVQVVGAQGAIVDDATDAASAITQLNALLARLRTHGLIAI